MGPHTHITLKTLKEKIEIKILKWIIKRNKQECVCLVNQFVQYVDIHITVTLCGYFIHTQ